MVRIDQLGRTPNIVMARISRTAVFRCAALEGMDIRGGARVAVDANGIPANELLLCGMHIQGTDEIEKVRRERRITGIVHPFFNPSTRHSVDFGACVPLVAR